MDVYQASDGYLVQLNQTLNSYETLEPLIAEISIATGVTEQNVLLFLGDGRELRDEVLEEAWERGGQATLSTPPRQTVYLFNRETFWTDAEQWAVQLQEDVQLPIPLNRPPLMAPVSPMSDVSRVQQPFHMAHDHLSHLQSLYLAQARSLDIAYANLIHHLQPLIREFQCFAARAEKDLLTEEELIRGARVDMAMLTKVVVHEVFTRKKEKDGEVEGKSKTLADYVHPRKMEQVREACRVTHEEHVARFNDLASQMDELAAQSDAKRRAAEERAAVVGEEFAEGLARIGVALEQVEALLLTGAEGAAQGDSVVGLVQNEVDVADLMELDQAMRDDLVALTGVKNEYTLNVHVHLCQVALFQSRITEMVNPLTSLDSDLRTKAAFPHLHRLHQLPFAYGAAVVEVVRRKEFATFLLEWTSRLAETLEKYISTERMRRQELKMDTLGHLPWTVTALEESMAPNVKVSAVGGAEALVGTELGREDIDALMKWVEGLKEDPEILAAIEEGDANPIDFLQSSLEGIIKRMDVTSNELDKMIERSVLVSSQPRQRTSTDSQGLESLSGQLRAAEHFKAEHAKTIADLEDTHQRKLREVEAQHEQRTASLQNRQGELQEELVRLRTDLGDEMLARQAVLAQLEDHSREQEDRQREHEDQTELVTAFQADLAQEKDRSTDLGVRLQEALLDIDGLRNAEQSLTAQLQNLQDERSRSLQSLSEAQSHSHDMESEVAGVTAELKAMSEQLATARSERDSALKNQSAEAERVMRDHIAEADGDRAVLEHQNLALTKQVENVRAEMDEKLSSAKSAAVRQMDGLKAELSFTKAQLRDAQRRETILADELAMAKDAATAMTDEKTYQCDTTRDAVALVSRYFDCCQRLMTAINTSATISGTASTLAVRPRTPPSAVHSVSSTNDMRESILVRSLATASGFDLGGFAEAVQKTINLVKKWSKSCKQYRDLARNKISFTNFSKGDLALFLPTRNAAARSWAAFNISAPHNFLNLSDSMQEQTKTREWIIARIMKTEEAIASGGELPETNPFGLADGLMYYVHHVEEYKALTPRPARRTVSIGYIGQPPPDTSATQIHDSTIPLSATDAIDSMSPVSAARLRSSSGYFPTMPPFTKQSSTTEVTPAPIMPETTQSTSTSPQFDQPQSPASAQPGHLITPTRSNSTRISPVAAVIAATPHPRSSHQPVPSRPSPPSFGPSSLARPTSVASSASSHTKGPTVAAAASKAAPAMAITSAGDGTDSPSLPELQRRVLRKASSNSLSPAHEDLFRPSPLSEVSEPADLATSTLSNEADGSNLRPALLEAGGGQGSRRLSIAKKRITRGWGTGVEGKPTAVDMLRRFDGGGGA